MCKSFRVKTFAVLGTMLMLFSVTGCSGSNKKLTSSELTTSDYEKTKVVLESDSNKVYNISDENFTMSFSNLTFKNNMLSMSFTVKAKHNMDELAFPVLSLFKKNADINKEKGIIGSFTVKGANDFPSHLKKGESVECSYTCNLSDFVEKDSGYKNDLRLVLLTPVGDVYSEIYLKHPKEVVEDE